MERKFTDDEIVKALECCKTVNCFRCPFDGERGCVHECAESTLDLINRQKAEIERLEKELNTLTKQCYKSGIKEFAERWKKYWKAQMDVSTNQHQDEIVLRDIDNLVKEMTEGNNGN